MKLWISVLMIVAGTSLYGADTASILYHVQLVRATAGCAAPNQNARPLGKKLRERLGRTFAYSSYWEIDQQMVQVKAGQAGKYKSNGQELEIELLTPLKQEIRLWQSGKLVQKSRSPVATGSMAILGGQDLTNTWFLVVWRDKRQVE